MDNNYNQEQGDSQVADQICKTLMEKSKDYSTQDIYEEVYKYTPQVGD